MKCPGLLLLHIRERRGDAAQHALDVHIDHPVPFDDLEALEQRLWHQPRIVDHDVDTTVRLHGRVHQFLNLVAPVTSVVTASDLPPQRSARSPGLDAIDPPRTQHHACALHGEMPGGRLAQPAARARDDDDFSFGVIAHDLESSLP
jgi:hypothetical protein